MKVKCMLIENRIIVYYDHNYVFKTAEKKKTEENPHSFWSSLVAFLVYIGFSLSQLHIGPLGMSSHLTGSTFF